MKRATREWVDKAEGDHTIANQQLRARKAPNFDGGCFHAQQCVEKYLKALLQESGIPIPRTHHLEKLVDLLPPDPVWAGIRPRLIALNPYAVEFRYPGMTANKAALRDAMAACRAVRTHARFLLGLK